MRLLLSLQADNHWAGCCLGLALIKADIIVVLYSHCHLTWPSGSSSQPFIILNVRTLNLKERLSEMLLVLQQVVQLGFLTPRLGVLFTVLILQC